MDQIIGEANLEIAVLVVAGAMLIAWRAGIRLGNGLRIAGVAKPSKSDDASIALLSLLLAFTFGVSISKYDQRRVAVVADGNAIGDFYTCASLLKEPTRTRIQTVIRQYGELRLQLASAPIDDAGFEAALARFRRMHDQMTSLVQQAVNDGTPLAVSLINALNAVISNQALRLAAIRDHLPSSILILLFISAIISTLLIGREQGFAQNYEITGTLCFIFLVSSGIYVTLDLNRPERGFIRASQQPIEELLSSMPK